LELESNYGLAYWYRGLAHEQKHMFSEALQELEKARTLLGLMTVEANIGHLYAISGRMKKAEEIIRRLKDFSATKYVNPYGVALIYVGLGSVDQAFEWLEAAFSDRSDMLVYLNVDPRLDPIRSDSRFLELARRVGIHS
jgi:tetratricopeptide (TPR) repeat protein